MPRVLNVPSCYVSPHIGYDQFLLELHNVNTLPNTPNLHDNLIPILQKLRRLEPKPNTTRRSAQDQAPLLQRCARRAKGHNIPDPKQQIPCIPSLPRLAIDKTLQIQPTAIIQDTRAHDRGSERRVLVKGLGETPLRHAARLGLVHLPVAAADIVGNGVARDVVEGFFLADVLAVLTDDDCKLGFVVAFLLPDFGDRRRLAGVGYACSGLGEDGRVFGEVQTGFADWIVQRGGLVSLAIFPLDGL